MPPADIPCTARTTTTPPLPLRHPSGDRRVGHRPRSPIGGPVLGGWLIDNAHWLGRPSWTWIFLINLPIGLIGLVYAALVLPKDRTEPSESIDVIGLLLMSPGLAALLYGVSSIPDEGTFTATKVLGPMIVGVVLIAAFARWSMRPEHPLLDLRPLANRQFSVAALTMFLFATAFFGGLLLVPTYFQQVRGEDTFSAGLLMAPQGLGALVTMPIAGALIDRYPVGRIVPVGIALITGGMFELTRISSTSDYWGFITPVLFVMGLGMGATMMPLMTSSLKALTGPQVARGSTMLNITQQVASSFGVVIASVLLTAASTAGRSSARQRPSARRARESRTRTRCSSCSVGCPRSPTSWPA